MFRGAPESRFPCPGVSLGLRMREDTYEQTHHAEMQQAKELRKRRSLMAPKDTPQAFIELLRGLRAVRQFRQQAIPQEVIDVLRSAGSLVRERQ